MPEIMNTLFGRSKNTTVSSVDEVEPTVTITVEPTGSATATEDVAEGGVENAPSADDIAESTEGESSEGESTDHTPADSDSENSDDAAESTDVDDQADDDQADDEPVADEATDEATDETDAEESDEAAADKDTTEEPAAEVSDEDGDTAEDVEPVAAEADDTPVAAETTDVTTDDADDADDDDADQTEPVVVPVAVAARPAAGTRGSVTVGEGVVAKVVNIVVGKIDGVHSLDDEGISVELDNDIATVKVSFVVEFGHAIKALAEQIRIDVIEAVEQFLGLDVAAVDVHVSDIHAA